MASTAAPAPATDARNFAALLADIAVPEKKFPPARDLDGLDRLGLDGLADDIATLSYESALRTPARYRAESGPRPVAGPEGAQVNAARSTVPIPLPGVDPGRLNIVEAVPANANAARERFRCASVTVRLSPQENEQLRQRAAEAGITVSAYLRSCTFEVESLRAQVKATLAELRQARSANRDANEDAGNKGLRWLNWWPRSRRPAQSPAGTQFDSRT